MINGLYGILASFGSPIEIGTNAPALLLALPLIAVIAVVYKATKLEEVGFLAFAKEALLLFCSIVVFMILIAIGIFVFMKIAIG